MIKVAIIGGNERIKTTLSELLKQKYDSIEVLFIKNEAELINKTDTTLIKINDVIDVNQIYDRLDVLDLNVIDDIYIPNRKINNNLIVQMKKQDIKKNNNIVKQKIKSYKR
ncbi:MAG TPA: hypothetical protein PLV83_01425 [Bacilli bacterium]|nr:hypothetical protein [Bacilli bacterium]